ncbi:response regulator [Cohnella sp. CFH 77786]|uniref:response regulator n=1 Tax=Cohnella sp. CFH 77786 TaxID=2662265 RepID=UPI001C610203|nr:response regulator [Cohnella sp. CFH 77786]MBW5445420.1 response regulator [Cohnella sp. CFH 77786]
MKKVMLVDDEIVIRENIRESIDWERAGLIYCGDASDGETALPLIEKWNPDILITDIKMPFMDGLELSSIVRRRMPHMKIVILSGHDEFHYARSALRIGVEEYILKPIGAADLMQVLQSVCLKIDRENREKSAGAYTKDKLLADLCGGLVTTAEAAEAAASLGLPLLSRFYAAAVWDLRFPEPAADADAELLRRADAEIEARGRQLDGVLGYRRSRAEIVWIVTGDSCGEVELTLERLQQSILPELENALPCPVTVGIGSVQDRLQGIHASFMEAEEDRNWKRLTRMNELALREAAGIGSHEAAPLDRPKFVEFLKIGRPAGADGFIRGFAEGLRAIDWKSSLYGYYLMNDITLETLRAAKETFRPAELTEAAVGALQDKIRDIRSWEDAVRYLTLLAERFWEWRALASDKYGELIAAVKEFIHERYADDRLSLQDAAERVRVSPGHLSKVFSQETGQTFIEYLTQTRIRKAMELLQTTRDKTYEVAYRVGYNDAHYFSNLFKKMTGMTAREYRRQGAADVKAPEGDADATGGQVS